MKRYDVITIADLGVDLSLSGGIKAIEFDQSENLIDSATLEMGGSCSIFAVQCSKLGLRTKVIGTVGNDIFGKFITDTLVRYGVDTSSISVKKEVHTGVGVAISKGSSRAILTYLGSIDGETFSDIPLEDIRMSSHLHIGSYFLKKSLKKDFWKIAKAAKESGATVSLDTNWDIDDKWDLLEDDLVKYVDVFMPNETELYKFFGISDLAAALEKAVEIFPVVVVKLGDKGAIVKTKGCQYEQEPIDAEYKDSIGAGDSFDGGFIYGYINKFDLRTCLEFGTICGGLNVTEFGGIKGQPTLDIINKFRARRAI